MGQRGVIDVVRRYRFVVQDKDRHGNVRTYLRRPGLPKVRLRETPGTDAFDTEYRKALAAKPAPEQAPVGTVLPGSMDALCVAYYRSSDFAQLAPRTQRVRRLILDHFRVQHGEKRAALLQAHHLERIKDAKAAAPEAANSLIKALRAVFACGVRLGLVQGNPALAVSYLASHNPDGIHTWTLEEVEQYEAHHPVGSMARLALALLLYTGQRRSDVVTFGRQHVRDGLLTFTQAKNRARKPVRLVLPVLPELQRIIDATPVEGLAFLTSERGTPFTVESFGNRFAKWCREAGLSGCSAHGLRKAAATRLANLGASGHEIMAVTGHRTLKEVDRYTREAAQQLLAASAMARMVPASARNGKVPPSPARPEWDESGTQETGTTGEKKWMVPRAGAKKPR
jgi:integrase